MTSSLKRSGRWKIGSGKPSIRPAHLEAELRKAFPEAWISGYKDLESGLTNDPKDRHVPAAAIRSGSQTIVTFNLKHFEPCALAKYDIEALHPDEFLVNQFYLDDALVTLKLTEQATAIRRTAADLLRSFHKSRALPLFSQTMADALSIELDPPIEGSFR